MKASPLIQELHQQLYDAVSNGDGDHLMGVMSQEPGFLFIGSDPKEWFTDGTAVGSMLADQAQAGIKVEAGDCVAYEEGTVAWSADSGNFLLPDGATRIPFRMTAVWRNEGGTWRIVQEHCSVAVTNDEAVGADF